MERTLDVAKALYQMYYDQTGEYMSEMKMHKLMYFTQREYLMYHSGQLFDGSFYGWKYGPVLLEVREAYRNERLLLEAPNLQSQETKELLQNVLDRYGSLSAWKLSSLSHDEFSWKKARRGLAADDNGSVELSLAVMKVDATKELLERAVEVN